MKKRLLSFLGTCIFGASMLMAQISLPYTITSDDGLPVQDGSFLNSIGIQNNPFAEWTSANYSFANPLNGVRLTVVHCYDKDNYNGNDGGSRGYVFFSLGEFFLYDAEGNPITLTAENFSTNAQEKNEGPISNLVDGNVNTFFHSAWSGTSDTPLVGGEHYIEITFPEPLSEFAIGLHRRELGGRLGDFPSEIIMTELGVDANPYPGVDVTMGGSASELEDGKMYVLADGGTVFDSPTYVAAAGAEPDKRFPFTSSTEYRIRKNVYADCLFEAVSAGDGYFYLKNLLAETYIKDAAGLQKQGASIESAGKFKIDGKDLVSESGNFYYISSTASFNAAAESTSGLNLYEATINNDYYVSILAGTIYEAEDALTQWKDTLPDYDQGEAEALESAISSAKAVTAENTVEEIYAAQGAVTTACIEFLKKPAYAAIDGLQDILNESSFGSNYGDYPFGQQEILNNLIDEISSKIDGAEMETIGQMIAYLSAMDKQIQLVLENFENSRITSVTLPLLLDSEDGLPYSGMPNINSYTQWASPTYSLSEPIEGIRLTVAHTAPSDGYNTKDNGSRGFVFFSLGEFFLYDGEGKQLSITETNLRSNAGETSEGPIYNLVDGNVNTFFHSTWNTTSNPPVGGEHYIEITFPEPLSSFSFGFYRRELGSLGSFPSVMYVSELGETPDTYADYEFQLGDKVSKVEPNKMYILSDNGLVYDKPYYVSSAAIESGYTVSNDYRIRETPFADCVFVTVDAGNGYFYLQNLAGKYVNDAYGRLTQTTSLASAAELYVDENGYLMSAKGYNLRTSPTASFEALDSLFRPLSFYAAEVKGSYLRPIFESCMASAEKALNVAQENVKEMDVYKSLEQLVSDAQFDETASSSDVLTKVSALNQAMGQLVKVELEACSEELFHAINDNTFEAEIGGYPMNQLAILEPCYDGLCIFIDENPNASAAKMLDQVVKANAVLSAFYPTKILAYSSWPFTDKAPEGVALGAVGKTGKQTYTSPLFLLEEPVKKFYVTNVHNPGHSRKDDGYDYMTILNFSVFDANGYEVPLTAENFATNAQEPTEGALENICDRNGDGTPNVGTFFHSLWSYSAPETGEHWVSVELPEALSAFSFEFCSRESGTMPNELVVGLEPYRSVYPEELSIDDFVGSCTWSWNDFWTPDEVKSFDATLTIDPDTVNGLILDNFNGYGPIKGIFDGTAHTITFPAGQLIGDGLVFSSKKGTDVVFYIDADDSTIKYNGQAGINVLDAETGEATNQWSELSFNWVTLTVDNSGTRVIQTSTTVSSEIYYTVDGRRIEKPMKGVNLIRRTYTDGTSSIQKIIVK